MFSYFWHQLPFFRVLICFISGVLLGVMQVQLMVFPAVFILLGLLVLAVKEYLKIGIFQDVLLGLGLQFLIFFTGFLSFWEIQTIQNRKNQAVASCDSLYLCPNGSPVSKPGKTFAQLNCSIFAYASGVALTQPLQFIRVQVDTQLCSYFPKNGIVIARKDLVPISEPENRGDFDFKAYAKRKNWFFQYRLRKGDRFILAKPVEPIELDFAEALTQTIRNHLYERYGKNSFSGLMMALLYGEDNEIEESLLQTYAATGTLHILAVSGMHVGLIYWLLGLLFNPLKKLKGGKVIHTVSILVGVWAYSLICGMGPSILRATVMVSMMLVSGLIERTYHPLNSLFATAFCLVVFNPYLICDAGFQLSFLAVLGLGLFYQDLYLLWEPNSWLLDQCWKLIAGSVAAQLCALPVTLYCFHQFPTWFVPANLVVVPLSTLLIYLGLAELTLTLVSEKLGAFAGQLVLWLLDAMNTIAAWIADLPLSVITGFWFEPSQWILFSIALLFLLVLFYRLSYGVLVAFLSAVLAFQTLGLKKEFTEVSQKTWMAYSSFGKKTWIWKSGGRACVFLPKDKAISEGLKDFLVRQHLQFQRVDLVYGSIFWVKTESGEFQIQVEAKRRLNQNLNRSP